MSGRWFGWRPFARQRFVEAEAAKLGEELRILKDVLRQIEWRLAMARSTAIDVNTAHGLAITALRGRGGIYPDSATNYQLASSRDNRLLQALAHPANRDFRERVLGTVEQPE